MRQASIIGALPHNLACGFFFTPEDLPLRRRLAHALQEKSRSKVRRALQECADMTTSRAWELPKQLWETASKPQNNPVHGFLAIKFEYFL